MWSILASWVATPLCAIVLAYVVFSCISYVVFSSENPIKQANWLVPLCMMLLVLIFSGVTIFQGLDTIGIQLLDWQKQAAIWALASVTYAVGWRYTQQMLKRTERLTTGKAAKRHVRKEVWNSFRHAVRQVWPVLTGQTMTLPAMQ